MAVELARGPRRGDLLVLRIDRLGQRGEGIGRLEAAVGPDRQARAWAVHVRFALPGESVSCEVLRRRKKRLDGRLVQVLTPSPDRVEPLCPHFGSPRDPGRGCGGCALEHLCPPAQRAAKRARVTRLLDRAGLASAVVEEPIAAAPERYYRNKMELSFGNDAQRRFSLGLHPAGFRYETLDLARCLLMSPFASSYAPALKRGAETAGWAAFDPRTGEGLLRTLTLREGKRTGEHMLIVGTEAGRAPPGFAGAFTALARRAAEQAGGSVDSLWWVERRAARGHPTEHLEHHLFGARTLAEELHLPGGRRLRFAVAPRAFFQPCTLGAEAIYAAVLGLLGLGPSGEGSPGCRRRRPPSASSQPGTIVDLYCGTGTIGLCVAPFVRRVLGIELRPDAVANAAANAAANGITNAEFIAGDAAEVLAARATDLTEVAAVVVDPPRSGLSPEALRQVAGLGAPRIGYVACRPESLARDAAALHAHGYELRVVRPIDQFPHTGHIECVALLERPDGGGA